jgi:hypothetical protein
MSAFDEVVKVPAVAGDPLRTATLSISPATRA